MFSFFDLLHNVTCSEDKEAVLNLNENPGAVACRPFLLFVIIECCYCYGELRKMFFDEACAFIAQEYCVRFILQFRRERHF